MAPAPQRRIPVRRIDPKRLVTQGGQSVGNIKTAGAKPAVYVRKAAVNPFQNARRVIRKNKVSQGAMVHALLAFGVVIALALASAQAVIETSARGPRGHDGAPGGPGVNGIAALVETSTEAPGGNCVEGGIEVDSGLDDGDGGGTGGDFILQPGEIDQIAYVCDGSGGSGSGAAGNDSLVETTTEAPGVNCAEGGIRIDVGVDNGDGAGTPKDGILHDDEIDFTSYVCDGAPGADGADGVNGTNGDDGYMSLIVTAVESAGGNCAAGGFKVDIGIDNGDGGGTAGDATLQSGEIDVTRYICHGAAGAAGADGNDGADGTDGHNSLITSTAESAGVNCVYAGIKVSAGVDNGDGGGTADNAVLESGEVDSIGYACNGAPGRDSGLKYTYSTGTSGDPGAGKFGFDTVTLSAIATLRISETDGDGNAIAALLAVWDDSTTTDRAFITVIGDSAPTRLLVFKITSAITDNGAYDSFSVSHVTNSGVHANNDVDKVHFQRTGDRGTDGTSGTDGENSGLKYTYDTGTSGDPGSGKFGFDSVTLASITSFRISETDGDSNGLAALIATWDDSTTTDRTFITVIGDGVPTRLIVFKITSAMTDNGAYDSFSITYIASSGSHADENLDRIFFSRTGDKGADGSNGAAGADGSDGTDGANAALKYTYDTGTSGDPGTGKFGFDTTTLASIATLRISETDGDGNAISAYIATWDDSTTTDRGIVTVVGDGVPTRLLIFKITSAITDNGAYDSFSVTHIANSGSHADEDADRLWFSRSGDKGDTGTAGSNGNGFTVVDAITAAAFTTTSTTGSEVTALTNTLSATGTYWARYILLIRTAATGTGIDFGINFDNTNGVIVAEMRYQDGGTTASTGTCDGVVTGDGGEFIIGGGSVNSESTTTPNLNVITGVVSTTEDCLVTIDVIVATTASGDLELWCASDVNTSQVDVRIGSSVVIIKTA